MAAAAAADPIANRIFSSVSFIAIFFTIILLFSLNSVPLPNVSVGFVLPDQADTLPRLPYVMRLRWRVM
jgi:hypothetical protein